MAKNEQRRFARLRRVFRWCRIFILLAILAALAAGIYLNKIGLPDFLKRPLLARLHEKGVQLDFTRMRLRWYRGIVADNAQFTLLKLADQPKFSSAQADLNLDFRALLASHLRVNSVAVKNGNLIWPIAKTNLSALSFSNITAQISFLSGDEMRFTELNGDFARARIQISGALTNASAIRAWKIFQPRKPGGKKGGANPFLDALEKIRLTGAPELTLKIDGDAANPKTLRGSLHFATDRAETPWGNARRLQIAAEFPDGLGGAQNNFIRVKMDSAETRWGSASNLFSIVKLSGSPTNAAFETDLKIFAKNFQTGTTRAGSIQFSGRASHSTTNFKPNEIHGEVNLIAAETRWGKSDSAEIIFLATTNGATKIADASWAGWRKIAPFRIDWESDLAGIETPKLKIEKISSAGLWSAPRFAVSNFNAQLYNGGIQAAGELNVASREISLNGFSDFDAQKISPLLSTNIQHWMTNFTLEKPPRIEAKLRAVLPSWTNAAPDWRKEVLPTLALGGAFSVGRASYRGIDVLSAKSDFGFTNQIWTLPNLRVERSEGGADLNLIANEITREFHWLVHSEIDPKTIRLLLAKKAQRVLDDFQFTSPPVIRADIRGNWNASEKISGNGEIALQNFSYRSNHIDKTTASLLLTNQQLRVSDLHLETGKKFVTAESVALNFPTKRLSFTNIQSTVDPYVAAGLIGKKALKAIAPYRFSEPPSIRVNGGLTIGTIDDADLHFEIDGAQFRWMKLNADKMSGHVDWVGNTLLLTNVQAQIYQGSAAGWSYFKFLPHDGADFRFDVAAANIDLRSVVKSVKGKTNRLEGILGGELSMESGNTADPKTLRGHGRVNVRDGLLWDVPLFGIFSPILNAIVPGAGSSRAHQASATFNINRGMVDSDDLEIRAATLRLEYRGGVDFEQHIDARVDAELLRDTWIVGRLVSLALTPISKLFEFKVTGTLAHPESEPVYIPNFLMMTLRPFHTIKKALTPEKPASTQTQPVPEQSPTTPN